MYPYISVSCIFLLTYASANENFKEEYTTFDDKGRDLLVRSSGRLRRTIDLNDEFIVAKTMCTESVVRVSIASNTGGDDWRVGDLVIGSSALGCHISFVNPGEGLLGIVASIEKKRRGLLYLTIEKASPLDVLEEANVSVHVKHRRSKRSNTNFLSNILDSINWRENSNTTLKLNRNMKSFSILKSSNYPEPTVGIQNEISPDQNTETEFNFTCFACIGTVDLSYHLEMRIERDPATNKPIVKSYLSQMEGEAVNSYNFSIKSQKEQTILVEKKIMETEPIFLPPITLATFKRFPPIQLQISVNSSTFLLGDITTFSSKKLDVKDTFQTSGKFVVSNQHFQNQASPIPHLSTYDWQTQHFPKNDSHHSNDSFSINIRMSHEIFFKPFIEWNERDIKMDFGSPFTVRINQDVNLASSVSDVSLCTEMESRTTSVFYSGKNSLIVDAFGFQKWGEVSTLIAAKSSNVTLDQKSLFKNCRANCFEPPPLTLSIESCGSPGNVMFRNSSTFSSLRKLFGDLILFASEEYSESSWCGHPGNPCLDCSDYFRDDNVCSDRYVTPELAEVLTKLAKYISAEWKNRKLLILEGWDEPTSSNPYGSFGNQSLFYTGKAARVGLSKTLTSKEPETDETIFRRFVELVQCSEVDYFSTFTKDSVLDICVSDESPSLFTNQEKRRKKRAIKSNNIVKTNSWKEEKDKYNDRIVDLVNVNTVGSTINDYFKSGKYHPRNKTAEGTCGEADDMYSIDNMDQMQRQIQYPLENVEFETEGPKTSTCGAPTRQCNQCESYKDTENPWDWCLTRTMTTRAATRLHRLATLVKEETDPGNTPSLSNVELGVCRSGVVLFQTLDKCVENMPSTTTDKETKCYGCIKDARCCYGNSDIGCLKNDCSGDQSTSVWTRITCTEPNPFASGVSLPATPACNQGDSSKMVLYDNVCGGDPCQFFSGKEYHLLLKVVLIFEVCSGKWDESVMDEDIENLNIGEKDLMTFLKSCMGYDETILKIHYPIPNDPTIGIGFSLREISGSSQKKDLLLKVLPNLDYDKILTGEQSITKEQALFLYDKTMRRYYIKSINSIVPFKTFVHLDTATKIALVNANYRGEFPSTLKKKFNAAVVNGQWASAVAAYLDHPDFENNKCSTTGRGSICTRMKWNAEQFRKHVNKQVKVLRRESSSTSSLQNVGRSLKMTLKNGVSMSISKFANMAVVAGFDHVTKEADHIRACVRPATGVNSVVVNYPNLNMHETEPPVKDILEYEIPAEADYSLSYPLLLDGHNDSIKLSQCYKISDVKLGKFRYFRFDPKLLECLEDASSDSSECINIIPGSGYRVRSQNNRNIDIRHPEERWRFSVGMAVELGKDMTLEQLKKLGLTVIRSCVQNLIRRRLILGIGAHPDRLYVDIRESTATEQYVKVWDAGSPSLYRYLSDIETGFKNGGAFIEPTNRTRACQPPPLGQNAFYIKYSNEGSCVSDTATSSLCSSTSSVRSKAAKDLLQRLDEVTGNGPLDKALLRRKVNKCLVELCGGCIGKGQIWREKTLACFDFVTYFLSGSSTSLPDLRNVGAFFNTQNTKSEVHSLACHDGSACIENIQLHSLLQETLSTKYKPDTSQTNEELVFDPMDNTSPLLDILEQEMAMRVSGNVSVYIENNGDVSRLNHKIKILMTYNTKVTNVDFHLTNSVRKNQMVASIQRKLERWASSLCPDNARVTVAPYTVHVISGARHKRSIDKSLDRNIAKQLRNNWELEWLAKT